MIWVEVEFVLDCLLDEQFIAIRQYQITILPLRKAAEERNLLYTMTET